MQVFEQIAGLNTSINTVQRAPNSLYDASNVVFTRSGSVSSRKGHPDYWLPVSTVPYNTIKWIGMWEHPTETESLFIAAAGRNGVFTLINGVYGENAIKDFRTGTGNIRTGTTPFGTTAGNLYTPSFLWDSATSEYMQPTVFSTQKNQYFTAANGLFRANQGADNSTFKKVVPLLVTSVTADASTAGTADEKWLQPGHRVTLTMLVRERISETGFIDWADYGDIVVTNIYYPACSISLSSMKVHCPNIENLDDASVHIYRTAQYPVSEASPVEKYFVTAIPLSKSTKTNSTTVTMTTVILGEKDDWVTSQEPLYNSSDNKKRNAQAPASKYAKQFKDFTLYGNIQVPPIAKLSITGLPAVGSTLSVNGSTPIAFRDFSNGTVAPSSAGFLTDWSTSDVGTASYGGGSGKTPSGSYPIVLRDLPNNPALTGVYGVKAPIKTTKKLQYSNVGDTRNIKCKLNVSSTMDVGPFEAPGICAVVNTSNGVILDVFSYSDLEFISSAAKMEFVGTQSISSWNSGVYEPISGDTTASLYLHFIPATSFNAMSVYAIGADASAYNVNTGFSLLPTMYNETYKFLDTPVGNIASLTYTGGRIYAYINFHGIRNRDVISATVESVKQWVKEYNTARDTTLGSTFPPFASFYVVDQTINISFESILQGQGAPDYLRITRSGDVPTEPDVITTGTGTDLIFDGVTVANGIVISKKNIPDIVTKDQILSPLKVGSDDKAINGIAVTNDAAYIFKEKEGIYRASIVEGGIAASFSGLYLIDNTVWCMAPSSIQEIDDAVYFLSNKGFARLVGNNVTIISAPIDIEVRNVIKKSKDYLSNVRSFGNETRKQYGCHIPSASTTVTYVLDIPSAEWSKWDLAFDAAYVSNDSRLFTINTDSINRRSLRADKLTSTLDDAVDQFDFSVDLTGASVVTAASDYLILDRVDATTVYGSLNNIVPKVEGKSPYYYSAASATLYPVVVTVNSGTSIKVQFESAAPTFAAGDKIYLGVNASITFNRHFPTGMSGTSQFSHLHLYSNTNTNDVRVDFTGYNGNYDFNLQESVTFGAESDIMVTLIPRAYARGNWAAVRINHSYPLQPFELDAIAYGIRSLKSDNVERGN